MFFIFVVFQVLPFIIVPIIIISILVKVRKRYKNQLESSETFRNTISNANDPNSYGKSISSEPTDITCDYCGTSYIRVKQKCPSCGAKKSTKD